MYRDTWAEIDLAQIRENVIQIRKFLPRSTKLMAVVKANAYGHGDIETAKEAVEAGADYLACAFIEEAIRLRTAGLKQPILILTPIRPELVPLALAHDLMLTVTQASWFHEMRKYKPVHTPHKVSVHVKMDTGLGRIGIRTQEEWLEMVPWLRASDVVVDGFYTHFATAGEEDNRYLQLQIQRFLEMKEWSSMSRIPINHYHCAGSVAALRFPELCMDMARIGAAIYGFYPEKLVPNIQLKPAFSMHSRLLQTKKLKKGEYVGYNNAYRTDSDQWIGTVPIGYADGWSQRMQNSEVLVEGVRAEIIGKISMDQLMVKLPMYFPEGSKVTFIGCSGEQEIPIQELAHHISGVSQEITSSITDRVLRMYKEGGVLHHEITGSRTKTY